jgi:putative ABC transport system permease protein
MGRLSFSGLLSNGRSDLAVVGEGVDADKEARLGSFLNIIAGRQLDATDRYGVVVGSGAANSLSLKPGDRVTVLLNTVHGAMNSIDLEVVGVFQTFSKEFDARAIRVPLAAAQELFGSEGVNNIVVALHRTEDTDAIVAGLAARLDQQTYEIKTWRQLNDFYQKAVDLYDRQFGVLRLIVLLMVLLTVANTVNMSVFERVGEFGTLKALGNRNMDVFRLVLSENALIGAAGAIFGLAVGIAAAVAITAAGFEMPPPPNANSGYRMAIRLAPQAVLTSAAIGLIAAVLASIPPALRVARRPIAESLRQNQ